MTKVQQQKKARELESRIAKMQEECRAIGLEFAKAWPIPSGTYAGPYSASHKDADEANGTMAFIGDHLDVVASRLSNIANRK